MSFGDFFRTIGHGIESGLSAADTFLGNAAMTQKYGPDWRDRLEEQRRKEEEDRAYRAAQIEALQALANKREAVDPLAAMKLEADRATYGKTIRENSPEALAQAVQEKSSKAAATSREEFMKAAENGFNPAALPGYKDADPTLQQAAQERYKRAVRREEVLITGKPKEPGEAKATPFEKIRHGLGGLTVTEVPGTPKRPATGNEVIREAVRRAQVTGQPLTPDEQAQVAPAMEVMRNMAAADARHRALGANVVGQPGADQATTAGGVFQQSSGLTPDEQTKQIQAKIQLGDTDEIDASAQAHLDRNIPPRAWDPILAYEYLNLLASRAQGAGQPLTPDMVPPGLAEAAARAFQLHQAGQIQLPSITGGQ